MSFRRINWHSNWVRLFGLLLLITIVVMLTDKLILPLIPIKLRNRVRYTVYISSLVIAYVKNLFGIKDSINKNSNTPKELTLVVQKTSEILIYKGFLIKLRL